MFSWIDFNDKKCVIERKLFVVSRYRIDLNSMGRLGA